MLWILCFVDPDILDTFLPCILITHVALTYLLLSHVTSLTVPFFCYRHLHSYRPSRSRFARSHIRIPHPCFYELNLVLLAITLMLLCIDENHSFTRTRRQCVIVKIVVIKEKL